MALGYRAVFRLPATQNAVRVAEEQMRSWLRGKVRPDRPRGLTTADWDGPGVHETGPAAHLTVVRHEGEDGAVRELLRHVEHDGHRDWTVSVVAASVPGAREPQSLVIELDVGGMDADEAVTQGAPPNFVRNVLDAVDVHDGGTPVFATPRVVHLPEVPFLIDHIRDPRRNVAVVVAGAAPEAPVEAWRDAIAELLKRSQGVATGFVLTEDAHQALAVWLPDSHSVNHMTVRSFAPGVDLDDPADGPRHRVLSPRTLERHLKVTPRGFRMEGHLAKVHARTSRQRFLDQPLPADLSRTLRILSREEILEQRIALPPVVEIPSVDPMPTIVEPESADLVEDRAWDGADRRAPRLDVVELGTAEFARVVGILRALGAPEASPDQLAGAERELVRLRADAQLAEEMAERAAELEKVTVDDLGTLEKLAVEEAQARRLAEKDARLLRRQVQDLQRRLRDLQQYDVYDVPQEVEEYEPDDIRDIIDTLCSGSGSPICEYVVFTGDAGKAYEVDGRDGHRRYRDDLWEQVNVLYDYARTKYDGNLRAYLEDPEVTTRKISVTRYAATESETVKSGTKSAAQRLLPVPREVDPSGYVHMWAHFKLRGPSLYVPRLHFHDDTHNTGKVYLGYFGKHLDTTMKGN